MNTVRPRTTEASADGENAPAPGAERRVLATAAAPLLGTDVLEGARAVAGEWGPPHAAPFVELPDAGPGYAAPARTITHLPGLSVDLAPAGWRLTASRAGDDAAARRSAAAFSTQLSALSDALRGEAAGECVIDLLGPASLVARLALPGGEPVASDPGAVRDVAQAWVEATVELAAMAQASVDGLRATIRLAEPDFDAVTSGRVRSSSGYRTLPAWRAQAVRAVWEEAAARVSLWVPAHLARHGDEAPGAWAVPSAAALTMRQPRDSPQPWEDVAEWLEAGSRVVVWLDPATLGASEEARRVPPSRRAAAFLRDFRRVGLSSAELGGLTVGAPAGAPLDVGAFVARTRAVLSLAEALESERLDAGSLAATES